MTDQSHQPEEEQQTEEQATESAPVVETNVDYKDKWLRAQADYQNLVKETAERRSELVAMSELQIIEEFLPVYSNFATAFAHETDESGFANWKQGIEFIMKQFGDVLKTHGIEEITTVGEQFDETRHEAVGEEESDQSSGIILKQVAVGYTMKDRVIQPAKVIVSS